MVVQFIDDHKDRFGVEPICTVLTEHGCKIAPLTYYAFRTRPVSARALRDAELIEDIERVFWHRDKGRGISGARKMWRLLKCEGIEVPRCTVERLMHQQGLQGVRRGKQFVTTRPDTAVVRPPDLVERQFSADRPNQLWVVDFTYVPTWSGMAFTAFVTDVFSRRIVGWRTTNQMPTQLPLDALEMALWTCDRADETVEGLIHHSDAGAQYTALRYSQRLADIGALASIGSVGDSFDNAMAESVVGLYKNECVKIDGPFPTADELELTTLSWVHWFNKNRLHSSIDYLTPIQKKQQHYCQNNSRPHPRPGELALQQTQGDSVGTVWRYVSEAVNLLAAHRPTLRTTLSEPGRFVILDGTIIATDSVADLSFYCGHKHRFGVNIQAVISLSGRLLWMSDGLPGSVHDIAPQELMESSQH